MTSSEARTGRPAHSVRTGRALRRGLIGLTLLLSTSGLTGCGEHEPVPESARRTIEVKDLPPGVIDAARKRLPEIQFDEAWSNVNKSGGIVSFEIRGRGANGKIREVRVSPEGQILEME